jgi:cytochrome c biogenesis protein CcdA
MHELLGTGAFGAALLFGFRHGFDWDHLAALTDLTGSQTSSRRSMVLATLYALGHAVMILLFGFAAIVFTAHLPDSVDGVMERVAGVTLVALGIWIVWTAATTRAAPPTRSRWMLLIDAVRNLLSRRRGSRPVVIEHSHPHDHDHPLHSHTHGETLGAEEVDGADGAHVHAHGTRAAATGTGTAPAIAIVHAHTHRHLAPVDPFMTYDGWSSFGIGLLHGVGAETPTQIVVFVAASNASSRPASVALLVCFVIGLVASNTLVATASTFGFRRVLRTRTATAVLAGVTAVFSIGVGLVFLLGHASGLPSLFGT